MVKQEEQQHVWMMNLARAVIPIVESWLIKKILLVSMMVIKTYNVQLPKNLMYLGLHAPKDGKLHPCENFHSMNTCHLHIG
jgi:hypothetical protein